MKRLFAPVTVPTLLFACLSACGPLEGMEIVPIKYAPVTTISSRALPPTSPGTNSPEIPEINGCWEHVPADGAQPVTRRSFSSFSSYGYYYGAAHLSRADRKLEQVFEKGNANYQPKQSQVLLSLSGRSRKEAITRTDESTLEIDGAVYTKIESDPCW